jgi:hypothetical protein
MRPIRSALTGKRGRMHTLRPASQLTAPCRHVAIYGRCGLRVNRRRDVPVNEECHMQFGDLRGWIAALKREGEPARPPTTAPR